MKQSEVAQSCPTLCDSVDCSPPGSSIHGILQARILEWVAISFSRGSSRPRDRNQVSRIAGRCFKLWANIALHKHNTEIKNNIEIKLVLYLIILEGHGPLKGLMTVYEWNKQQNLVIGKCHVLIYHFLPWKSRLGRASKRKNTNNSETAFNRRHKLT